VSQVQAATSPAFLPGEEASHYQHQQQAQLQLHPQQPSFLQPQPAQRPPAQRAGAGPPLRVPAGGGLPHSVLLLGATVEDECVCCTRGRGRKKKWVPQNALMVVNGVTVPRVVPHTCDTCRNYIGKMFKKDSTKSLTAESVERLRRFGYDVVRGPEDPPSLQSLRRDGWQSQVEPQRVLVQANSSRLLQPGTVVRAHFFVTFPKGLKGANLPNPTILLNVLPDIHSISAVDPSSGAFAPATLVAASSLSCVFSAQCSVVSVGHQHVRLLAEVHLKDTLAADLCLPAGTKRRAELVLQMPAVGVATGRGNAPRWLPETSITSFWFVASDAPPRNRPAAAAPPPPTAPPTAVSLPPSSHHAARAGGHVPGGGVPGSHAVSATSVSTSTSTPVSSVSAPVGVPAQRPPVPPPRRQHNAAANTAAANTAAANATSMRPDAFAIAGGRRFSADQVLVVGGGGSSAGLGGNGVAGRTTAGAHAAAPAVVPATTAPQKSLHRPISAHIARRVQVEPPRTTSLSANPGRMQRAFSAPTAAVAATMERLRSQVATGRLAAIDSMEADDGDNVGDEDLTFFDEDGYMFGPSASRVVCVQCAVLQATSLTRVCFVCPSTRLGPSLATNLSGGRVRFGRTTAWPGGCVQSNPGVCTGRSDEHEHVRATSPHQRRSAHGRNAGTATTRGAGGRSV